MADDSSRFASLSADDLQSILENRDSANTKNCINAAKRILSDYCGEKQLVLDEVLNKPKGNIAEFLINFYAEVRKKNGDMYSRMSMISLRFGVQRHVQSLRKFDIINDEDFRLANEMFKAVLTAIKRTGKGTVTHKEIISDADIDKLFSSNVVSVNSPQSLQYKVFIDIMFYTCRRGRENLRCMKKADFQLKTDAQGRRYFVNKAKYETKNHRGTDLNDDDVAAGRIYEIPGNPRCPVISLEKYLAKLNPNSECFWQRPKKVFTETDQLWYDNIAVGHNTLGNLMKTISTKACLSQVYTNHCIRATCITALDNKGVEARHIMSISGHKSETSIKSYARNVTEEKQHEMCSVLQNVVAGTTSDKENVPANEQSNVINQTSENINLFPLMELAANNQMEELNENEFLSEVTRVERANNVPLPNPRGLGPIFQNVQMVQIHYHVNGST